MTEDLPHSIRYYTVEYAPYFLDNKRPTGVLPEGHDDEPHPVLPALTAVATPAIIARDGLTSFASDELAARFYDDFRNGLVHEAKIKQGGQFSLELQSTVQEL